MSMEDNLYGESGMRHRRKSENAWSKFTGTETFGPSKLFKMSNFKNTKKIRICLSIAVAIILPYVIYCFYSMRPPKFEVRRPVLSDLSEHRQMRGDMSVELRDKVIPLLEESCGLNGYTILFCHNVYVDDNSLAYPCFMRCADALFLYSIVITETDSDETISCVERYANKTQTFTRPKYVVINGRRDSSLQAYIRIPNSTSESCVFQHANAILAGKWLDN